MNSRNMIAREMLDAADVTIARQRWLDAKEDANGCRSYHDGDVGDLMHEKASQLLLRYCRLYREFYHTEPPELA